MIIFNIIYFILLILILLGVSLYDYSKGEIPNILSFFLFLLNLVFYFVHIKDNWYLPLISSIGLFLLMFILFLISGESLIGGGDMKIICSSLLVLYNFEMIFNYLLWFSVFGLFGYILAKIKKEKYLRIGPHLSLALLCTISPFGLIETISIALLFVSLTIGLSYVFFCKELISNDEKVNNLLKI